MSTSAIIFGVTAISILWGGFIVCLRIAVKNQK
ncbi:MetS family NSS transporter small subunit [Clostridiaceae bacterium M8S5]|nr:MetS family NSS transporter small subunit [Clostridiaceae bacterium M8S5]